MQFRSGPIIVQRKLTIKDTPVDPFNPVSVREATEHLRRALELDPGSPASERMLKWVIISSIYYITAITMLTWCVSICLQLNCSLQNRIEPAAEEGPLEGDHRSKRMRLESELSPQYIGP